MVNDFVRIIVCGITSFRDAQRLCEVTVKDVNPDTGIPLEVEQQELQRQQQQRKTKDSVAASKRPRADIKDKLTKKFMRMPKKSAAVVSSGLSAEFMEKSRKGQFGTASEVSSDKAVSVAAASVGMNMDGMKKSKSKPKGAHKNLLEKMRKLDKKTTSHASHWED